MTGREDHSLKCLFTQSLVGEVVTNGGTDDASDDRADYVPLIDLTTHEGLVSCAV